MPMWSSRTILKYGLIQIPSIVLFYVFLMVLDRWVPLSSWLMWGLMGVWVAKDIALYPLVWRAYKWRSEGKDHPMVGLHGVAQDRLSPSGQVYVRGELWQARVMEGDDPIEEGEGVLIQGIRGLTLLVVREPEDKCSD